MRRRRACDNLALLCLLAMVALLALPRLMGDRPAGEHPTGTAPCAIAAGTASSHHAGTMTDIPAAPYQGAFSSSKLRGIRPLLTSSARVALLPAFAWALAEPQPATFEPPAEFLPPPAQALLACLPDRAPPTV